MAPDSALLSIAQMTRADSLAIAGGVPGARLMEAAGWAVALELRRRFRPCRVLVLCGPGNNGGDGYVAARHLERWGYAVRLAALGDVAALTGDAALMAGEWRGGVETLAPDSLDGADMVVDALFGAGLQRPLAGIAAATIDEIGRRRLPVIAVDVPPTRWPPSPSFAARPAICCCPAGSNAARWWSPISASRPRCRTALARSSVKMGPSVGCAASRCRAPTVINTPAATLWWSVAVK